MWGRDRTSELFERLVTTLAIKPSDPLLIEHMADCVRDRKKTDDRLEDIQKQIREQNTTSLAMHEENRTARGQDNSAATRRFIMLLVAMLTALLAPWAAQLFHGLHG